MLTAHHAQFYTYSDVCHSRLRDGGDSGWWEEDQTFSMQGDTRENIGFRVTRPRGWGMRRGMQAWQLLPGHEDFSLCSERWSWAGWGIFIHTFVKKKWPRGWLKAIPPRGVGVSGAGGQAARQPAPSPLVSVSTSGRGNSGRSRRAWS